MADPRIRQITIKTGVVKRLAKEKTVYQKEVISETNRLKKFEAEGRDVHDLRKQQEVIQECQMMVPDCQRRLTKAAEELDAFLKNEDELKEAKEYIAALEVLESARTVLEN